MRTIIVSAADSDSYATRLAEAARALRDGALVVFPTETVYGVGANAADPSAVARLCELKGRENTQPFTVHLGQRGDARRYLASPPALVRRLARKAWPGPLTLIVEQPAPEKTDVARDCPPEQLRELYRNGTIGLRCPDHPAAARLLTEAGVPIVASSANLHGAPPPFEMGEALRDLDGRVDYAIDGGRTRHSVPSTIVEIRSGGWKLLRAGAMDERTVERLASSEVLFVCTGNSCRSPMAEYLFRDGLAKRLGCPIESLVATGYRVSSAGTAASGGAGASSGALDELVRRGIDGGEHRSQPLTVELIQRAERIYTMSPEHRQAVLDLVPGAAGRVAMLDPARFVPDPVGGTLEQYRACAEQIERAVKARLEEFVDEDRNW